jgi:hypothetical protein
MSEKRMKAATLSAVAIGGLVAGLAMPAAARETKHLINGNSIKKDTVTGKQIKESSLGTVPKAKRLPPLSWHELVIVGGWKTADSGHEGAPACAVDAQGFVHLKGSIHDGLTNTVALKLPAKARPAHTLFVAVDEDSSTTGRLYIYPNGDVQVLDDPDSPGSAGLFTSLEGVVLWPGA